MCEINNASRYNFSKTSVALSCLLQTVFAALHLTDSQKLLIAVLEHHIDRDGLRIGIVMAHPAGSFTSYAVTSVAPTKERRYKRPTTRLGVLHPMCSMRLEDMFRRPQAEAAVWIGVEQD
jgi:hypothetical protein